MNWRRPICKSATRCQVISINHSDVETKQSLEKRFSRRNTSLFPDRSASNSLSRVNISFFLSTSGSAACSSLCLLTNSRLIQTSLYTFSKSTPSSPNRLPDSVRSRNGPLAFAWNNGMNMEETNAHMRESMESISAFCRLQLRHVLPFVCSQILTLFCRPFIFLIDAISPASSRLVKLSAAPERLPNSFIPSHWRGITMYMENHMRIWRSQWSQY
jgi:hypothetical protein